MCQELGQNGVVGKVLIIYFMFYFVVLLTCVISCFTLPVAVLFPPVLTVHIGKFISSFLSLAVSRATLCVFVLAVSNVLAVFVFQWFEFCFVLLFYGSFLFFGLRIFACVQTDLWF